MSTCATLQAYRVKYKSLLPNANQQGRTVETNFCTLLDTLAECVLLVSTTSWAHGLEPKQFQTTAEIAKRSKVASIDSGDVIIGHGGNSAIESVHDLV